MKTPSLALTGTIAVITALIFLCPGLNLIGWIPADIISNITGIDIHKVLFCEILVTVITLWLFLPGIVRHLAQKKTTKVWHRRW